MERINKEYAEALAWLRFVLNPGDTMPSITDWRALYDFCDKHKIGGVCEPTRFDVHVDEEVLLDWMALKIQLQRTNTILNQQVNDYFHVLESDGLRCCLLKGQGNTYLYPNSSLRVPGDIDVWIDMDKKSIDRYFINKNPEAKQSFKHLKVFYEGTPVDVHDIPLKLYNPNHQKHLNRWLEDSREEQFAHRVSLMSDGHTVCVPTAKFNAIYQMGHIMIHLLDEGVGLRHIVDYFYVLNSLGILPEDEKTKMISVLHKTGMMRVASGLMWIVHEVLGLPKEFLVTVPNQKYGKLMFEDILESGNFGRGSKRQKIEKKGFMFKGVVLALHNVLLFPLYPGEIPYKLIAKLKTFIKHITSKIWSSSIP
jgi:hypothetical protein